ncbi:MAG: hypothetical protein ABIO05_00985 [Ferruginibacter sp.]
MYNYDTVVEAINGLKERGYTIDFNLDNDRIICANKIHCLAPEQFEITEVHRFEGDTNPSDEDVVYAVESKDQMLKGVITSAFGSYADTVSTDLLRKLSMKP